MTIIDLTPLDLGIASLLVVGLAGLSLAQGLGLERRILIAAARTAIQLYLIGLVLKILFGPIHPAWIGGLTLIMLLVAGREAMARQERRFTGLWGFGIGTASMFLSSFTITLLGLTVIIQPAPWYMPQYLIPLLGMMLGNTMNGIALALDRLTQLAWDRRGAIEAQLTLGATWQEAIAETRRQAMRTGMIPILNAMAAAGIVSLPGMMTGQILAGNPPQVAVKYQILIMFFIAAGAGLGTLAAIWLGVRRLFDARQRLRLDRLSSKQ